MNLFKVEKLKILHWLLEIAEIVYKYKILLAKTADDKPVFSDDKERYLEMAIRFDSNDMYILFRK